MRTLAIPPPGSRGFVAAIVAAQVLTQIGAFTLPALLPDYIERWHLSKTEAGWLVGIFFAAYVPAVPVLLALTDRLPTRRIYLLGTGLTALSHLGFALFADGFWSGLLMRALAGIGWAGAYMPGLKAVADPLEGAAQSRAVSWHAAGVGIAGAASFAVASLFNTLAGPTGAFLFGAGAAMTAFAIALIVMPRELPGHATGARDRRAARLPAGVPESRGDGLDCRLHGPHLGTRGIAGLGRHVPDRHVARFGAPAWLPSPPVLFTAAGLAGVAVSVTGNETAQRYGRAWVVLWAMMAAAALSLLTGWMIGVSVLLAVLAVVAWNVASISTARR